MIVSLIFVLVSTQRLVDKRQVKASIMSVPAISIPARAVHKATVIFSHGLGDSGAGWSFLPELFASQGVLPEVKWILPNAPNSPVTINGGMKMPSWYDITSLVDIDQVRLVGRSGHLRPLSTSW